MLQSDALDFSAEPVDTSVMSGRGVSALGRAVVASAGLVLAAILISACGSTHIRSGPTVVHLDGRVTGGYVRETSATGANFLVPTRVLAAQGATSFDVASPPADNSNHNPDRAGAHLCNRRADAARGEQVVHGSVDHWNDA